METIVELSTGGPEITARIKRNDRIIHGQTVTIGAEPEQVLAFDAATGARLRA